MAIHSDTPRAVRRTISVQLNLIALLEFTVGWQA
jgi:hypothetical protein